MNLIFDWSGTLADDERLTFELTRDCVAHFGGGDLDWEAYRSEFTIPVDRFYGSRCPGTDIAEIDRWFFESYGERLGEVALFDGVAQLLGEAVREHRLFILSTLKTDLIAGALSRLGLADLFEEVVGDAFDKRDHLPSLIRRHGLEPMETLFFGDTTHDVEAGRASGLQTAAVTWGYTESSVLEGSRPDHLFRRVPGVARHLRDEATLDAADRPVATSGGLVFRSDGRALFIKTRKWSDKWGTPGGKIQRGESMEDAFRREVEEETALRAEGVRFVLAQDGVDLPEFYKTRHFLLLNFVAHTADTDVRLNYEASEFKWATLPEARRMDLNEPTRRLIEHLGARSHVGEIFVKDLRVRCIVGILPREREEEQEILVDVEMQHDFAAAAATEDVTTTVDYAEVSTVLTGWIQERRFQLIETMAVEGCDLILERWPGVAYVRLTIKKPDAVPAARYTAVTFDRARES